VSSQYSSSRGRRWHALRWLGIASAFWLGTACAESYLILSLIGDRLTVVGAERQVGSNLDRNSQQVVPLNDQSLDDFSVRAADAALRRLRPAASTTMLRASDPSLYSLRDSWLDADSVNTQALLSVVAKMAPPTADTRLLLIAPRRDELDMRTDRSYTFTGSKIAGLGFYVDQVTRMRTLPAGEKGGEAGRGFLGVFANFQLLLINLETGAIDAYRKVATGTTFAASAAPDKVAWNAISAEKKLQVLQFLVKREIDGALPDMLSSAAAKP
jgi:hypothetical protein